MTKQSRIDWVLLSYRIPREPSTPRIAIWRRLRSLGVAQLGDGLVALPADARTQEHLEWVADAVAAAGGSARLWRGHLLSRADEAQVMGEMSAARAGEYAALTDLAQAYAAALGAPASHPGDAGQAGHSGPAGDAGVAGVGGLAGHANPTGPGERAVAMRHVRSCRAEWRKISRRDYFRPPERDIARLAVADLAERVTPRPLTPRPLTPRPLTPQSPTPQAPTRQAPTRQAPTPQSPSRRSPVPSPSASPSPSGAGT